jgi:hypothetical protein
MPVLLFLTEKDIWIPAFAGMTPKTPSILRFVQAACPAAMAPVQVDPWPAAQTKQWPSVTILLEERAA